MDWKTCQLKLSVSSIKDTQPSVHQRHFHYFPEKKALFVRFYILNFFCQNVLIVLRYRFIRDSGNSEKLKTFVSSYVTTIKFTTYKNTVFKEQHNRSDTKQLITFRNSRKIQMTP